MFVIDQNVYTFYRTGEKYTLGYTKCCKNNIFTIRRLKMTHPASSSTQHITHPDWWSRRLSLDKLLHPVTVFIKKVWLQPRLKMAAESVRTPRATTWLLRPAACPSPSHRRSRNFRHLGSDLTSPPSRAIEISSFKFAYILKIKDFMKLLSGF